MKDRYNFSKGERGKFYWPGAGHQIPVYLDSDVQTFLTARADANGMSLSELVNELLKRDIEIVKLLDE